MKKVLLALITVVLIASPALADKIYLKNGMTVEGKIYKVTKKEVYVRIADAGSMVFKWKKIKKLVYDAADGSGYLPTAEQRSIMEKERRRMKQRRETEEKKLERKRKAGAEEESEKEEKGRPLPVPLGKEAEEIKTLVFQLGHRTTGFRENAKAKLVDYGAKALAPLMGALTSKNRQQATNAAWVLGRIGDRRALGALRKAKDKADEWTREEIDKAVNLINRKSPPTAKKADPAEALVQKGIEKEDAGDFRGALKAFNSAIEKSPKYAPAYLARAVRLYEDGKPRKAAGDLAASTHLDERLSFFWKREGLAGKENVSFAELVNVYNAALQLDPRDTDTLGRRAFALSWSGKSDAALEDFGTLVELLPQSSVPLYHRGVVKAMSGDFNGASEDFTAALELVPGLVKALLARAEMKGADKKFEDALEDFAASVKINPSCEAAYFGAGSLNMLKEDYDGAIADFNRAIEIFPGYIDAWAGRAFAKRAKKEYPGAIADFGKIIELDKNNAGAHLNRGELLLLKEDLTGAVADFNRVIEMEPENIRAYAGRAEANCIKKDFKNGIKDYDKLIELMPKEGRWWHLHGLVKREMGDEPGALKDFQKARDMGYEHKE